MKRIIITLAILLQFFATVASAQKDTTKIRMGNKKIIIIDDNEIRGKQRLQNAKLEFQAEILELENKIDSLKKVRTEAKNDEQQAVVDQKIKELNKQIDALNKGIADTEKQIEEYDKSDDNKDYKDWGDSRWEPFFKEDEDHENFDAHWSGFEFGLNNYVNKDFDMTLPEDGEFMELNSGKSWSYSLNLLEFNIPIHKKYFGLVTGLGFEWDNYRFEKNITLVENEDGKIAGVPTDKDLYKNTLNTTYLTAPLLWEFQIPIEQNRKRKKCGDDGNDHKFFISAGVIGGLKIHSKTKQFYKMDGDKVKSRSKGDYQVSPFRYGITARLGYGMFRVYANYQLVSLFEKNKGPELYPFTIGISIINF